MVDRPDILTVTDLTVGLGDWDTPLVKRLSFALPTGGTLGITGASGVGKSITARTLVGLLGGGPRVQGGSVRLRLEGNDYDLLRLSNRRWRKLRGHTISLINQDAQTSLNPVIRCGDQLMESARALGLGRHEMDRAIELVGLGDQRARLAKDRPHEFSGGQQQRMLIAMAVMGGPRLLIADEPTTALDTIAEVGIVTLLKNLREELDMSLLFITHDLGLLARISDTALLLRGGGQSSSIAPVVEIAERYASSRPRRFELPPRRSRGRRWLSIKNLAVGYGDPEVPVVAGCSFNLRRREWLALVGPSGCGKSTLAAWMVGLRGADGGEITVAGEEAPIATASLTGRATRKLLRGQLIFQNVQQALNPKLQVGHLLEEVISHYGSDETVSGLLDAVGLDPGRYAKRLPAALSGGQRQRVAIARALAANPQLLICDEAVASLDYGVRSQILTLLDNLRRDRGLTIFFITHDLSLVRAHADRILIMRDGRIVERGPADRVLATPRSATAQALVAASANRIL